MILKINKPYMAIMTWRHIWTDTSKFVRFGTSVPAFIWSL